MGAFDDIANITVPDPDRPASEAFRAKHGESATEEQEFRVKWKWDAGEQVLMRGAFTAADHEAVQNANSPSSPVQGKQVKQIESRAGSGQIKLLERMIVDWTFTRNGRKVEVNPAAIRRLPSNYLTPLLEKCDEIALSGMSEEEQEDFLRSSNESTTAHSKTTR